MKKGDVGWQNASLKQGMSIQLPAIRKLCQDACQRLMLPTSLPQEEAAKTHMVSLVKILIFTVDEGIVNTCI